MRGFYAGAQICPRELKFAPNREGLEKRSESLISTGH